MTSQPTLLATDLEGVLVPEIWIAVAERTGIERLRLTTRDVPDYDHLMRGRIAILREHGLKLADIQAVIAGIEPLPGALDQDQFANAGVLAQAGAALRIPQAEFTPDRLASEISALASDPGRLAAMAAAARAAGRLDAAERLAELVTKVAGI